MGDAECTLQEEEPGVQPLPLIGERAKEENFQRLHKVEK